MFQEEVIARLAIPANFQQVDQEYAERCVSELYTTALQEPLVEDYYITSRINDVTCVLRILMVSYIETKRFL